MFNIIISNLGQEQVNTVNARDLHEFLESKQEFRHWIKNRIEQYGFTENVDYVTSDKIIRGNETKDYHLSLDMAKELSMVERNAKGKKARQYFIECEKKAKQAPITKELSRMDLIQLAMQAEQENQELRALNTEQVKVIIEQKDVIETQQDFIDNAFKLHDTMSVDYYCKLISTKHDTFGAVKFRSLMKISGRFVMNNDTNQYMPNQEMITTGQMEYKVKSPYIDDNGVEHQHSQIRITKKGARTLYAICKKYQKFFKMNENETKGYQYKPMSERREFLNSLLID
jgi:phage anti-repressor protein